MNLQIPVRFWSIFDPLCCLLPLYLVLVLVVIYVRKGGRVVAISNHLRDTILIEPLACQVVI